MMKQYFVWFTCRKFCWGYSLLLVECKVAKRLGPVVQKPINANTRLKINRGVNFSTPKCCSTLIFGKTLH